MTKNLFATSLIALTTLFSLGCQPEGQSAPPPTPTVTPLESSIKLEWTDDPTLTYWVFYAPGTTMNADNWSKVPGAQSVMGVRPPYTVSNLVNGTQYTVAVNARRDGGKGGPWASQTATPRLAGGDWVVNTAVVSSPAFKGLAYGTRFVAVGAGATVSDASIYYSADGGKNASWTAAKANVLNSPTVTANFNAVTYGGIYVAVGGSAACWMSSDGVLWSDESSDCSTAASSQHLNAVASNGSAYVAVGASGTIIKRTEDTAGAVNWSPVTASTANNLNAIVHANGKFIAVGDSGTVVEITQVANINGALNWTATVKSNPDVTAPGISFGQNLARIVFGNNKYIALGADGKRYVSDDGTDNSWSLDSSTPWAATAVNAIAYGTQFVAIESDGTVFTKASVDTAWQQVSAILGGGAVQAIARGNNGYVAVGSNGFNATSY